MLAPVRTVAPAADLVDLRLVKEHLRIDHRDDEFLLGQLVQAAIDLLDGWRGILGRCIAAQSWRSYASDLTDRPLPFPEVQSITAVRYLDPAGVEQVLAASAYRVAEVEDGAWIIFDPSAPLPTLAPRADAVRIEAVYGPAVVAPALRTAILFMAAAWYEGREGDKSLPPAAEALIAPFRRWWI